MEKRAAGIKTLKTPADGPWRILGGLLLPWFFLLLVSLPASRAAQDTGAADDACIRCHVELFNEGLRQQHPHAPFFERRCSTCHLARDIQSLAIFQPESTNFGDFPDNRESQRKKRRTYRAPSRTLEQLFNLGELPIDRDYRLRILVGEKPGKALAASQWLALDLSAIAPGEVPKDLVLTGEGASSIGDYVRFPSLTRLSSGAVLLAWKTVLPLFGWIELETLGSSPSAEEATDMAQAEGTVGLPGQHPPLRNLEALSITVCYQCHPASSLGTSHPVRLYGGKGVRIPDELPTVDGMLTCVTCHDPHGSAGEKLVRERIKTKLCVACHYQFRNSSPSTMFD